MVSVLSCATFTAEDDIPSPSAAMRASDVSEPVRSTLPTMTVIVPSFSRRQAAAAGSVPPGQTPAASPVVHREQSSVPCVLPIGGAPVLFAGTQANRYETTYDGLPWDHPP